MITNLADGAQAFTSNVFLVRGERTVLIDAGSNFDVVAGIRDHVDALDALILTHTHPDHIGNADAICETFDVETWGYDETHRAVDQTLSDGQEVLLGDGVFEAIFTPGHATDHLCFYNEGDGILFAGDLIFANGAVGRIDFAGGDGAALLASVERIANEVRGTLQAFHPGHGPSVTTHVENHIEMAQQAARMV